MIRRLFSLTLFGLLVGSVVGVMAVGFVEAILWLNEHLYLTTSARESASSTTLVNALTVGVPAVGGLVVGLLRLAMRGRRFEGPQDVIEIAHTPDPAMPVRSGLLSTLSAMLSLGAGASVGQYGPLAHMGASVGSWISRALRLERPLGRIGIACGCAAAISAAFHAPIAGLVFSREVILRHYSLRAFAPIAVSSILGYVVAHIVFDRAPLFRVDPLPVASPLEYLVFIAIGVTGAMVAAVFMRAIEFAGRLSARLQWPEPIKTALAGLALGIVALQIPQVLGIGQETLRMTLGGDVFGAADLAIILLAKLLLTSLCLGFGFAGGVFSPALLIGTLFGALIGTGAELIVGDHHSPVAVYAVCGMVAVASPVIGAPLTTVLIVFELTQNFDLATAALASAAFANLVGFRVYGRSFFDVQLRSRGFDLTLGRDKVTAQQHSIHCLVSSGYTSVGVSGTLRQARDALTRDRRSEAYVVDADGRYIGTLTLHRLLELAAAGTSLDATVGDYATPEALILGPDDSIWTAMERMKGFVGESIPVVNGGRLVGVAFASTIVSAYIDVLGRVREEEHAAV